MDSRRSRCEARATIERSVRGHSVASELFAGAPLRLISPRNGGHAVWIFSTIFGPGLMGGDEASMALRVGAGAACYVGSVGVSRAFAGSSRLRQTIEVAEGGLLVWSPEALACGRGADVEVETEVTLAAGASLLLVDAVHAGRVLLAERWSFHRLRSSLRVTQAGREVLCDQIDLRPDELPVAQHMRGFDAFATLLALGPRAQGAAARWLREPPSSSSGSLMSSVAVGDGAARRLAAGEGGLQKAAMISLGNLAEILGDDPRACRF